MISDISRKHLEIHKNTLRLIKNVGAWREGGRDGREGGREGNG